MAIAYCRAYHSFASKTSRGQLIYIHSFSFSFFHPVLASKAVCLLSLGLTPTSLPHFCTPNLRSRQSHPPPTARVGSKQRHDTNRTSITKPRNTMHIPKSPSTIATMAPAAEDSYFNRAFFDAIDTYVRQHGPQHHHQKIAESFQREFGMKSKADLKQLATSWTAEKLAQREISRQNEHECITMLRNCGFGWDNASGMIFGSEEMWAVVAKVRPSACVSSESTVN